MKGNRIKKQGELLPQTEIQFLSDGTVQVRYNFSEQAESEERPASIDYDYVNITQLDRDAIIRAIIRDRYACIDDEIAIINNKDAKPEEYAAYQAHREFAKEVADEIL